MKNFIHRLLLFCIIACGFFCYFLSASDTYAAVDYNGFHLKTFNSNSTTLVCPNGSSNAGSGSYTIYSGNNFILKVPYKPYVVPSTALLLETGSVIFNIDHNNIIPTSLSFQGRSDGAITGIAGSSPSFLVGETNSIQVLGSTTRTGTHADIYLSIPNKSWDVILDNPLIFNETLYPSNILYTREFGLDAGPVSQPNLNFCYQIYVGFCGDGVVDSGSNSYVFDTGVFQANMNDGVLNGGEECDDGNNTNGDGCSSTCQNEDSPNVSITKRNGIYNPAGGGSCTAQPSSYTYHKGETMCYVITLTNNGGNYAVPGNTIILDEDPDFYLGGFGCKVIAGGSFTTCLLSSAPNYMVSLSAGSTFTGGGNTISFFLSGVVNDDLLSSLSFSNYHNTLTGNNYISGFGTLGYMDTYFTYPDIQISGSVSSLAGKKIGDDVIFDFTITNSGSYVYSGAMVLSGDFKNTITNITITRQGGSNANCINYNNQTISSIFGINIVNAGSNLPVGQKCIYKITGKLAKYFSTTIFPFYAGYTGGPNMTDDIANPEPAFSPYFPNNNKINLSSSFAQSGTFLLDKKVAIYDDTKTLANQSYDISKVVSSGDVVVFRISGYNNTNAIWSGSNFVTLNDRITPSPYNSIQFNVTGNLPLFIPLNPTNRTFNMVGGQTISPGSGFVFYLTGLITQDYFDDMFAGLDIVTNNITGVARLSMYGGTDITAGPATANITAGEFSVIETDKYISGDNYFMSGGDKVYYFSQSDRSSYYFKIQNNGNTGYINDGYSNLFDIYTLSDFNVLNMHVNITNQQTNNPNFPGTTIYAYSLEEGSPGAICPSHSPQGPPWNITYPTGYMRANTGIVGSYGYIGDTELSSNNSSILEIPVGGYCTYRLNFSVKNPTILSSTGCLIIRDYGYYGYGMPNNTDGLSYVDICLYKTDRNITKTIGTGFDGSGYVTGTDHFNIGDTYIYQVCATPIVPANVFEDQLFLHDIYNTGMEMDIKDITISPEFIQGNIADIYDRSDDYWYGIWLTGLDIGSGDTVCVNMTGIITNEIEFDGSGSFFNTSCWSQGIEATLTGCVVETGYLNKTDIGITKSLTGEMPEGGYTVGDSISFAIIVYNSGNRAVTGWTVQDTDILDGAGGLKIENITPIPGTCGAYSHGDPIDGNFYINPINPGLLPGESCTFTISGIISEVTLFNGFCSNTVSLTGIVPEETDFFTGVFENNTYTLTGINCVPLGTGELQVTKTANKENYVIGEYIDYTITITNIGSGKVEGFTLTDILPGGVTYVGPSINITGPNGGETMTWNGIDLIIFNTANYTLDPGEVVTITFRVQATQAGDICNTATASWDFDRSPWNDPTDYNTGHQVCVDVVQPSCINLVPIINITNINGNQITVNYICPDVGLDLDDFEAFDPLSWPNINIIGSSPGPDLNGNLTYTLPAGFDINNPNSTLGFQCDYSYPNNFTGGVPVTCPGSIGIPTPSCDLIQNICSYDQGIEVTCQTGQNNQGNITSVVILMDGNPTTPPTIGSSLPLIYDYSGLPSAGASYNFTCEVTNQYGLTGSCETTCGIANEGQCNIVVNANPNHVAQGSTSTVIASCNITDSQGDITITNFTSTIPGSSRSPGSNSWTINNVGVGDYDFNCQLSNGQSCPGNINITEGSLNCPDGSTPPITCPSGQTVSPDGCSCVSGPTDPPSSSSSSSSGGPEQPKCGPASGEMYNNISQFPSDASQLCAPGTPTNVTTSPDPLSSPGIWEWECVGAEGTTPATCQASYNIDPVDGICPSPNPTILPYQTLPPSNTNYDATCTQGTVVGLTCNGGTPWTSCTWTCEGLNGGNPSQQCEVKRTFCGDGIKNGSEQCDPKDPATPNCSAQCTSSEPTCIDPTISPAPEYFIDSLPGNFQVTCNGTSPSTLTISNTPFNQTTANGSISVPGNTFTNVGTYVFNCNHGKTSTGLDVICYQEIEIKKRDRECPPANTDQVLTWTATPGHFYISNNTIAIGGTANITCKNIAVGPGGNKQGSPQGITVDPTSNTTIVGTNITFTKEGNYTVSCNFDIAGGTNPYQCKYDIEVIKPICELSEVTLDKEEEFASIVPFPPSVPILPPSLSSLFDIHCQNTIGSAGFPYQSTNLRKGEYNLKCFLKPVGINPLPEGFPTNLFCEKEFSVLPVGAAGTCKNMIIVNGQIVPNNGSIDLPAGDLSISCLDSTYQVSPGSTAFLTGSNSPLTITCSKGDVICVGDVKVKPSTGNQYCNPNGQLETQNGEQCDPQLNNNGSNLACNNTTPNGYCNDQCTCQTDTSIVNCGQGITITLQGEQTLGSSVNISCQGGESTTSYTINGQSSQGSTINISTTGDYEAICSVSTGGQTYECPQSFTIEGNTPTDEEGCQNLFISPSGPYNTTPTSLSFACVGLPANGPFKIELKKSNGTALTSFDDQNGSYDFTTPGSYVATCKVGDSDNICTQNIEITNTEPKCEVVPTVIKEDEYGQVDYTVNLQPPSTSQNNLDIQCGFNKGGFLLGYQKARGGTFSSIRKGVYEIVCLIKSKDQTSREGAQECKGGPINILPVGAAGACKEAISVQVGTKISDNPYIFTTQNNTVIVTCNGGMTLQGPSTLDMMVQSSYEVSCVKGDIVCPAVIKTEPRCGDNQVQADKGEECDQGDDNGKDGINCTNLCKLIDKNMNCPANLSISPSSPAKNQTTTIKCDGIGGEMKGIVNGPAGSSNLAGNGPNLSATFVPTVDGSYNVTCTLSSGGLSMECGQGSFTIGSGDNGSGDNNGNGSGDNGSGTYDPNNDPNLYDLAISKTVISDITQIGSPVVFEITVRNEGLLLATGFSIKDLTSGFSKVQVGRSLSTLRNYNGDLTQDILLAYPLTLSGKSSQTFYFSGLLQSSGFVNKVQVCNYDSSLDPDSDSCNGYDVGEDDDATAEGDIYSSIVGDLVRNDTNKNGLQNTGEQGIKDIKVVLYRCENNQIVSTITTDTIGKYNFSKVQPGDYKVGFVLPSGYKFTQADIGANDSIDSDVSSRSQGSSTGYTACFTAVGGVNKLNQDAGMYYEGATLSVTKKADRKFVTTGEYVKWFITFKNTSNQVITSYTLQDVIPPSMRYVSIYLSGEQENLAACGYPSGGFTTGQTVVGNITNAHMSGGVECVFVLSTQVRENSTQKLHTNEVCIDGPSFDNTCTQAQVEQISLCKNISLDTDFGDNPLDVNFTCTLTGSNSGHIKIFDATEKLLGSFGLSGKYTFNAPGNYYIECVSNFADRCIRPIEVRELSECTSFSVTERSTQDYDITCSGSDVQDMQIRVYEGYIDPISQKVIGQVVYQTGGSVGRYKIGGGRYVFQCLINGTVDYQYDYLSGAKSPLYSCYYKNLPNGAICAVKAQVAPFKVSVPNLKDFKYVPEPIVYCPSTGDLTCNSFQESKLMVKDYICRKEIIIPQPDLVVMKTGNKLIYNSGDIIDYKINFYNSGDGKVEGFKLIDDLPLGMKLVSWSGSFSFIPAGLTNTITQNITTNIFLQSGSQLSWNIQGVMGDHKPVTLSGYLNIKAQVVENNNYPLKNKMFGVVVDDSYLPNNLGQYTIYPSGWNFSGTNIIGDKVWSDANFDGIQDPLERGVKNIRVELMNCSGQVLDYTYSDTNGYYKFDNIMSGYYKVAAVLNKNWIFTYGKIGRDDKIDSDITIGNTTNCRYVSGSTSELNIDVGLYDISQYPEGSCNYNNIREENLGEQCDGEDGIKGNYEKCIKCTKFTYNSVCGDGVLQPNEDCEKNSDGKYNDINITGTTCVDCKFYSGAVCGNGIIEGNEKCEVNSVPVKGLQCIGCQLVVNTLAQCGNGIQEVGEACDLGSGNGTFATIGGSGANRDMRCSANCNVINCDYNFCFSPQAPSCTQSDSPNVMVGEYFPFWWNIDDRLITNSTQCTPGKIPVSSVMCYFSLYNGKQGTTANSVYDFMQPCVSLSTYNQTLLSFFNPISASFMGRSYIHMDTKKVNDTFGEYKLSLNKITYNVCGNSGDVSKKEINGVDLIGGVSQNVICEYNFTVTRPFLIQVGNSISTNQTDRLKNFYGFASNQGKTNILDQYSISLNLLTISKFTVNNNISYLINQFVSRVDKLSLVDISYGPKAKKVPNSNIFVYDGDLVYSETTKPTSDPHTIVLRRGSLTISGDIGGQNMFIVQDGDITFAGGCEANQTANGVFITNGKLLSDKNYQNTNLLNKRCAGGGLIINGFVIGDGLSELVNQRRANLYGWFLDDSRYGKYNAIMNGGSVVIKQNLGLSTSPPPGFDEFASIYETIKK